VSPAPEPPDRRQTAGFSVFLDEVAGPAGTTRWETRLYHAETGAETTLPGVNPDAWVDWMLGHAGAPHPRRRRRGPAIEVGAVEIVGVTAEERTDGTTSVHTVTAEVLIRLDGVAGLERHLGAQLLRGIAAHAPGAMEAP